VPSGFSENKVGVCGGGGRGVAQSHGLTNLLLSYGIYNSHFLIGCGFVFLVHIQENLEDELVKEALEKVGNNALGADFL